MIATFIPILVIFLLQTMKEFNTWISSFPTTKATYILRGNHFNMLLKTEHVHHKIFCCHTYNHVSTNPHCTGTRYNLSFPVPKFKGGFQIYIYSNMNVTNS